MCPAGDGGAGGAEHGGVDGQGVGGGGRAGREEEQDGGQRAARDEGQDVSGLVLVGYNLEKGEIDKQYKRVYSCNVGGYVWSSLLHFLVFLHQLLNYVA